MDEQDKVIIEVDESELEAQKEAKKTNRVLSFRLGTEHYCIDITDAKEVFKPLFMTRVPNTPGFVMGVTNLHGEIIPLIDIRYFLGLEQKEGLGGTKVITTDVKGSLIGVMVDDVDEARDIIEESIQPPLATIKGRLAEFTKGQVELNKEILIMIDLERIMNCEEINGLKKG
jgi:purine-binding chemotaxis protein CheW